MQHSPAVMDCRIASSRRRRPERLQLASGASSRIPSPRSLRADAKLAALQDSLMPIEVGDADLRAGLTEVRQLIDGLSQHARSFVRTFRTVDTSARRPRPADATMSPERAQHTRKARKRRRVLLSSGRLRGGRLRRRLSAMSLRAGASRRRGKQTVSSAGGRGFWFPCEGRCDYWSGVATRHPEP